ncbi:MAG: helix-turn-helix domain-containing protein [Bryobacteraceae bacterium]
MDEPSPWRDVAAEFARIRREDHENVAANWIASGWTAPGDTWYLTGTPNSRVHQHFKWAAERAIVILGGQPGPQTLFLWLDLLRANSPNYVATPHTRDRGGLTVEDKAGIVQSICRASEEYCFKLETEYIADKPFRESRGRTKGLSDIVRFRLTGATIETPRPLPPILPTPTQSTKRQESPSETVGQQIERLRTECRLSVEELAELMDLDPSTISRHQTNTLTPSLRHLGRYDKVFSKQLKRNIVIQKTPSKRK